MFDPSKYSDQELLAEYQRAKGVKQPQPQAQAAPVARPQGTIITELLDKINPRLTNSLVGAAEGYTGKTVGAGRRTAQDPYAAEYAKQSARAQFPGAAKQTPEQELEEFRKKKEIEAEFNAKNPGVPTGVYQYNPTTGQMDEVGQIPHGSILRNTTTPEDVAAKAGAQSAAQYGGDMATSDRAFGLRKEFQALPAVQDYQTIKNQVSSMDSLLREAPKYSESKLALDQGLISMFNKIIDPQSVVRESEYDRTPQNLSLANRFAGAFEKLRTGGAGLTQEDRQALVFGAKIIANSRGKMYNEQYSRYEGLSGQFGVKDPSLVVGGYGKHTDFPYVEQQQINRQQFAEGRDQGAQSGGGQPQHTPEQIQMYNQLRSQGVPAEQAKQQAGL